MNNDLEKIKLNLYDNAICFANEAVSCATRANENKQKWKFAIINIVQTIELSFKELLFREHFTLIYYDIINRDNTVSLSDSIKRIESILNIKFSDKEKLNISRAQKLRNKMIHNEFEFHPKQAQMHFINMFSLANFFFIKNFQCNLLDQLDSPLRDYIVETKEMINKLIEGAKTYFNENNISITERFVCPICSNSSFVTEEQKCYVCSHEEELIECQSCKELCFEGDLEDISRLFEYSNEGRQYKLENDFGYSDSVACLDCIPHIEEDIEKQRDDLAYYTEVNGLGKY